MRSNGSEKDKKKLWIRASGVDVSLAFIISLLLSASTSTSF